MPVGWGNIMGVEVDYSELSAAAKASILAAATADAAGKYTGSAAITTAIAVGVAAAATAAAIAYYAKGTVDSNVATAKAEAIAAAEAAGNATYRQKTLNTIWQQTLSGWTDAGVADTVVDIQTEGGIADCLTLDDNNSSLALEVNVPIVANSGKYDYLKLKVRKATNAAHSLYLNLYTDSTQIYSVQFGNNFIKVKHGAGWSAELSTMSVDTWYTITLKIDESLAKVWINGTYEGEFDLIVADSKINKLSFTSGGAEDELKAYIGEIEHAYENDIKDIFTF